MFNYLEKKNRTIFVKKYWFWKSNSQNRLKYTKICKPGYQSIFFYLLNHWFIDLEILQILKSPFFTNGFLVFEFFHVFYVESDSIDLLSICKPRYCLIFFTYRKHRFIELVILQIPKNLDFSKWNSRKKFSEPSTSNNEKNIGRPPLTTRVGNCKKIIPRKTELTELTEQMVISDWIPTVPRNRNSRNSVPNPSVEEKTARNSVP